MDDGAPIFAIAIVLIIVLFLLVIANSGAKFCPKCGERYSGNTIYCNKCGVELLERGKTNVSQDS